MELHQLVSKYPKIFKQYEGNPYFVNWSGVPAGWLPVIDKLCGAIQSYVDHTSVMDENGEWVKPSQPTCTQMKEKFGGLRFYTSNSDDYVEGMIHMAEHICDNTCQDCGSEEDLGVTKGWISVVCRTCAIRGGDHVSNNWEPKTNKHEKSEGESERPSE